MALVESIFRAFCLIECCSWYWIPNNIEDLEYRFTRHLIGQPLAHNLILKSIQSHLSNPKPTKPLVLSLHGSTGTGKSLVVKYIVESLYQKGFHSEYVQHYFVPRDFMHNDPEHLEEYRNRLADDIETKATECSQSVFIFNEIEQLPQELLDIILYYVSFHTPNKVRTTDFRKTIFIFISNVGGQQIIDLTAKNRLASIEREDFNTSQFQKLLSDLFFHENGRSERGAWVDRNLATVFVPFLPLERKHIRACIWQELKMMLKDKDDRFEFFEDDIFQQVLDLMEYTSISSFEYSISGCKRVHEKVHYVFETIRGTFKTKRKPTRESPDLYWIPNNFDGLKYRLKNQVVGQPMMSNLILRSISAHVSNDNPSKALVLSLHGSTGTGKNFVAQHIVESLYRKGYQSQYVQVYSISRDFMHNDPHHLQQYKERLKNDIEAKARACSQAIFIFDEIDQMPSQLLDTISSYLDFYVPSNNQPIDFRKTIFIFLSNTGGDAINELTAKYDGLGIPRDKFDILPFQTLLANVSFYEKGGFQYASLIERHLISFFIPFLPLERSHIRICILRQLQILMEQQQEQYEYSKQTIVDRVLQLLEFTSVSSFEYSRSGCKRVQQKLDYIFEVLRPTLKRKKIIEDL